MLWILCRYRLQAEDVHCGRQEDQAADMVSAHRVASPRMDTSSSITTVLQTQALVVPGSSDLCHYTNCLVKVSRRSC